MQTITTSRSVIADRLCCRVAKLWQKYKWKRNCVPNVVNTRQEAQLPLYPMAQKTFRNAEPFRHAHRLLPTFK